MLFEHCSSPMENHNSYGIALALAVAIGLVLIGPCFYAHRGHDHGMALIQCGNYYDAMRTWRDIRGTYPKTLMDMEAPLREGDPNFVEIHPDPWGGKDRLEFHGDAIHVCSAGPDRTPQTEDDICCIGKRE